MPVKQMLGGRLRRQKKEKKELVCQMEKSLYMKRNYEESVCQEEKSFFQEEE